MHIHMQHHNVTINKQTQEDFFRKIYTSHFICNVCVWEGVADRTETATFWPPSYGRQRCVFLVLLMLNRRPRGPLYWVMAFFTASYQHLLWTPIQSGAPSPFGLVWLSLSHLVYNSVRSSTVSNCNSSGAPRAPSAWCGFPYHISSITPSDL